MPRSKRHYRDAVTRMLRATGLNSVPEAALLVATLKDLAEQLDEGAGGRAMTAWISAQSKLQRFLDGHATSVEPKPTAAEKRAAARAAKAAEARPSGESLEGEDDDLTSFKKKRGIA